MTAPLFQIGQKYPTRGGGWAKRGHDSMIYAPCFWAMHSDGVRRLHWQDGALKTADRAYGVTDFDILPPRPTRTIRLNGRGNWALFEDGVKVGMFKDQWRAEEWQRRG